MRTQLAASPRDRETPWAPAARLMGRSLPLSSLQRVAGAPDVSVAWLVRDDENHTGEAECEGSTEELLGLVRDLPPEELRHVLGLVKAARSYLVGRRDD
jgi:hypothetical protein